MPAGPGRPGWDRNAPKIEMEAEPEPPGGANVDRHRLPSEFSICHVRVCLVRSQIRRQIRLRAAGPCETKRDRVEPEETKRNQARPRVVEQSLVRPRSN